jgi:dinuclear metal center YbgI/SA1388 family protein
MYSVAQVTNCITDFAPITYQEPYDNTGLQIGSPSDDVTGVILTLDVTEQVVDEAIHLKSNLIISHHPLIFSGIKSITGNTDTSKAIIKAIRNHISIYCCHTNIDNLGVGVNHKIAEKLHLQEFRVLKPLTGDLRKLIFFVPTDHAERLRNVVFEAGAGHIGNYDCCSFNSPGNGTFRPSDQAKPFVGELNQMHTEPETRVETIYPKHLEKKLIAAVLNAHPYEEVAYDIYSINNQNPTMGAGAIGRLKEPMDELAFLFFLKETFNIPHLRFSKLRELPVNRVALCGGSGSFLLNDAIHAGADVFLTSDIKYHQFFEAEQKIILIDIGHFESEQFTLEIFYELLTKNFSNFAVCFTKVRTNPINYI